MANITRNFVGGRMNKVYDERVLPEGEYVDAMNIRMGSTENSEIGVIENTKGNLALTRLSYINGTQLSGSAKCIGAIEDSANETIYWFVTDPNFNLAPTRKLDLILAYNVLTDILTYVVISINDGGNVNTTLNFNQNYLITGVDIINDLLLFTDGYNPPRFINIKRNYPNPVSNIDRITAESLLVIKKPPVQSPGVQPILIAGQENFLNTRFISFAYRYRYADGEYSATSQWSQPAFVPKQFSFSIESYLNEGMVNACNSAIITYNTGGPLVVEIELLFKKVNGNIIKVIEQLNKADLGLTDNSNRTYQFTNSKIFTILSESELLRLYDNVPRLAKAQTLMGNRLMYGNYVEGYNLVDNLGKPIKLEYTASLISEDIANTSLTDSLGVGSYSIDGSAISVTDSVFSFDLSGQSLTVGSAISLDITILHSRFSGTEPFPTETTDNITLNFSFTLPTTYSSVYALASSLEFLNAIGSTANIQTVANSCNGTTFTDFLNCALPNNLDGYFKKASGINGTGFPIGIITSPGSSIISLQLVAMQYVDDLTTPTQTFYEYYKVTLFEAFFQKVSNIQSLHSNRDYEVGIVYMDEFNRASTALVSPNNTVHVSCGLSPFKNSIQVRIPPTQRPPSWATRYKFVIKPDQENYETIFCSIFFESPDNNDAYFLLEGENARKVEVGDRLIVKSDTSGPTTTCVYATILDKSTQAANFLEIPSELDPTVMLPIPAGVYVKINPNSFSIVKDPDAIIAPGKIKETALAGNYPILFYPMNTARTAGFDPSNPTWEFSDYDVPAGSRIVLNFKQNRIGVGAQCEARSNSLDVTLVSSATYDNMYDWFIGDSVELVLNDGQRFAGSGACVPNNVFIDTITNTSGDIPLEFCNNNYRFYRNTVTNQLSLMVTGTQSCTGVVNSKKRASSVETNITVFRSDSTLIFETQPSDALPDVFFENELSFAITNGNHMGNVQNQTSSIPAIVNTNFFNCYSFGNGCESYKVLDSIVGNSFSFGNRVTSVSAQDYKRVERSSDITYSGIYNAESNINKLNEFNLGLLNYKTLEPSFGNIFIMDGRSTDVLVLQEDKVSYVLTGKNLLSDSTGGGVVASVPEVLGTQIARSEKYGISFNPESYVRWGYDRFFTDVKRGVVIQLKGDSYSNEQLKVISDLNMRTWFRDEFNTTFNTQKLGGFDPYMNEYVLSSNDRVLPFNVNCLACGITQSFNFSTEVEEQKTFEYCVNLGATVGLTDIVFNSAEISEGAEFEIVATYNGNIFTTGVTSAAGTLTFDKNQISVETVTIEITYTGDIELDVIANCCQAEELTIIQVVLTNDFESGQTINTQYRFTSGAFVSPLQSSLVVFAEGTENPLVSRYNVTTDLVGTGAFPPEGSTVALISNQFATDTFVFDPASDKFKYLMSNTLYNNNTEDISALLSLATTATPNEGGGTNNYAEFTVPALNNYLYLIWDFRASVPVTLCYSNVSLKDSCCNCDV
jgi:hypothetical protein